MKSLFHIFPIKSRLFPLNPVYSPALGILFDGLINKYENQTTDDISVFDNYNTWFEEEKAKLESQNKAKQNLQIGCQDQAAKPFK